MALCRSQLEALVCCFLLYLMNVEMILIAEEYKTPVGIIIFRFGLIQSLSLIETSTLVV